MGFLKKHLWAVGFALLLTAFTGYVLADVFLIEEVYSVVEDDSSFEFPSMALPSELQPEPSGSSSESASSRPESSEPSSEPASSGPKSSGPSSSEPSSEPSSSGPESSGPSSSEPSQAESSSPAPSGQDHYSYADADVRISIEKIREYNTDIYLADVIVSSPEHFRTAFARNAFGRHIAEKTSQTAQANQAILAINGDYYGAQSRGYVLRNGKLYRDTAVAGQEDLVVWADGSFEIIREDQVSAAELAERGAWQIFSFGPRLVVDGQVSVGSSNLNPRNPRTAIGIVGQGHYLFLVADGRSSASSGLTMTQLAEIMARQGSKVAYNLDGGGSSAMVFQGRLLNNPTMDGVSYGERSVSDIVFIR